METRAISATVARFLLESKKLLINGEWMESSSSDLLPVMNPATGERLTYIAAGNEEDVDRAVAAARAALEKGDWKKMTPMDRSKLLWKIADLIDLHADELAELETLDNGKPISISRNGDVKASSNVFRYYAGWPTKIVGETNPVSNGNYLNYTVREPVGVVGQIIPWNYPLMMAAWKLAPALAVGATVILKPAEQTSLTAIRLGELLIEAGVPAGVVNIVTGTGKKAGAAIANHPRIDKVAFTGSTEVGRHIMQAGAVNIKRTSLELGGKSPNIIFADADLEAASLGASEGVFYNMGQDCTAGSRVFVQRQVYEQVLERIVQYAENLRVGNGLDPLTDIGPIVSEEQVERISSYVEIGLEEGATLMSGGKRVTDGVLKHGHFIQPTVFANARNDSRIAQEEIFGPFVSVIPFDDAEEVISLANDSIYGLGAGIWTRDIGRAHSMAKSIKSGMIWINSYGAVDPASPFGGYKMSGYGREMGAYAIDLYTETKTVWVKMD
ncbi:aldehyde dehydrogenase family protein [Brevibacillus daliensis]|uniref:aldehyde dehydrogenase family protein n=1 Tax=Brevibacillus daliensis TaxID=2892995 RepID=UPI0035A04585